ncbi:MAG: hypothetical protein Sapg2KO_37410 [Saprospiraceae bacterium]
MNPALTPKLLMVLVFLFSHQSLWSQETKSLLFNFDQDLKSGEYQWDSKDFSFREGLDGKGLCLEPNTGFPNLNLADFLLDGNEDFSIQFWVKTDSKRPMVLVSQKDFPDKGISAQKNKGWVLYTSGGTFAWSIGSGDRRINYERDNGAQMPLNDGEWHQITMTFKQALREVRLYYDGHNKAIYKVNFDFSNADPLVIGTRQKSFDYTTQLTPDIILGKQQLQAFVDAFNQQGLSRVQNDEFIDLIVNPTELRDKKKAQAGDIPINEAAFEKVMELRRSLLSNPYTVFQIEELTLLKPVSKIYTLGDGQVTINPKTAQSFTQSEQLFPADFIMDQLSVEDRTLTEEEILDAYNKFYKSRAFKLSKKLKKITVGVWNIWHGGLHWTKEKDGWDSRLRIAEMIRAKDLDVVLLQETYSSGDFIAAELGYYYATTSDWDYCFQGSNISVLSRYPIEEIYVTEAGEFNNVGVQLAISKTQKVWAMSNWYGMNQFPAVFDFHQSRFEQSAINPVFFGGDFNAVPHTDGGQSPASKKMLDNGFTDAYRSWYPQVDQYPGFTHRSGQRIDQLYFKGKNIKHKQMEVISSWPSGFPSDHYLIVSQFKLLK